MIKSSFFFLKKEFQLVNKWLNAVKFKNKKNFFFLINFILNKHKEENFTYE
jgi:hypothetical protein